MVTPLWVMIQYSPNSPAKSGATIGTVTSYVLPGMTSADRLRVSMQLHGRLALAKQRPGKYRKAQIDGRGIESVDSVGEVDAKFLVHIELASNVDEPLGQLGVDAPIAPFAVSLTPNNELRPRRRTFSRHK